VGLTQHPVQWISEDRSPRIKWRGCEPNHSPLSGAEVTALLLHGDSCTFVLELRFLRWMFAAKSGGTFFRVKMVMTKIQRLSNPLIGLWCNADRHYLWNDWQWNLVLFGTVLHCFCFSRFHSQSHITSWVDSISVDWLHGTRVSWEANSSVAGQEIPRTIL